MRPKEFNRNRVLEKCISLFWNYGFRASGIEKIVATTNVQRFSLYSEFGNKEGILTASMKLYYERYASRRIDAITETGAIGTSIHEFYNTFLQGHENGHRPGCYIVTMATEVGDNPKVQTELDGYLNHLKEKFVSLLVHQYAKDVLANRMAEQLAYNYCAVMSLCTVLPEAQQEKHISSTLNLILDASTAPLQAG